MSKSRSPDPAGADSGRPFALERHPFYWMTQVMSRRDEQLAVALRALDLRVPEWRILGGLHARERSTMSELADVSSTDRTTLTRSVARMVKRGWVRRIGDRRDLRVVRLALTGPGRAVFASAVSAVDRLSGIAAGGLPDGALELLCWTLARMRDNLDRERKGGTDDR